MRRFLPLVAVLLLVAVAYIIATIPRANAENVPASGAVALNGPSLAASPTPGVEANATSVPLNIDLGSFPKPRVLAWNPNTALLAWYATGASPLSVGKASNAKSLMIPCGMSTSGDKMIIYQGGDISQPYLMPLDSGTTLPLGSNRGLACALPGRTQLSPDGNRLGILQVGESVVSQADPNGTLAYVLGNLRILGVSDGKELASIEGVAAFDLQNDGAVAVEFFTNAKNQANHADVVFWDGSKIRPLEQQINLMNTDEKASCEFVTARVARVNDQAYVMFGEKCKQGGSSWRLRSIPVAGGNGKDVVSGKTSNNGVAGYFYSTDTNELLALPGGKALLFAVPNGAASNIANIGRISLPDGKVDTVLAGVAMNQYPPSSQSEFVRSPKGDRIAMITRTGDGGEQLYIYDLNAPEKAPVSIAGGGKLDRINGFAWTADGQKLFYNAFGDTQALFMRAVGGDSKLVARGIYQGLALNADGSYASTSEHIKVGTNQFRDNLVLIKTDDATKTSLVEGAKGEQPLSPIIIR